MVRTVEVTDASASLAELVSLVNSGTQVVVTQAGSPVAVLVPANSPQAQRVANLHPGALEASDDFDEPLSDEFWAGNP